MNQIKKLTETFAWVDSYYHEFEDLLNDLDIKEWKGSPTEIKLTNCVLKKVIDVDRDELWRMFVNHFDENKSEDGDEWEKAERVFKSTFTEEQLSAMTEKMPSLWWPDGEIITISIDEVRMEIEKYEG